MGFLDDLVGLKNVIGNDGRTMPRRYAISFENATVADDEQREQTLIQFGGESAGELPSVSWTLQHDDDLCTAVGIAGAEIVRLNTPTDRWRLIGMTSADLTRPRKILVNDGDNTIVIGRTGAETPEGDSFIVPGGSMDLPHNGAIEVIWMPATADETSGWRLL